MGGTTDFEHSERQVVWPPKQKDQDGLFINHKSRGLSDGSWKDEMHLLRESAEDKIYCRSPSLMADYNSPVSSRSHNRLVHDQVEQVKHTETSAICRLFGIDLRNSNGIPSPVKEVTDSFTATDSGLHASSITLLEAHRAENLNLDKVNKQLLLEAIKEETKSKHDTNASKRTRIKVGRHILLI